MFPEVGTREVWKMLPFNTIRALSRFLRATKWNVTNCIKKLEAALKWRREYGIYDTLTLDSIKEHVGTLRICVLLVCAPDSELPLCSVHSV